MKYNDEKENCDSQMQKGHFDELAEETRILRNADASISASKPMIDRRIQRGDLALSSTLGEKPSPLSKHDDCFVDMIIKLSRCRCSIASGEGLQLINSLMKNTEIESDMNQWKKVNTRI